MQGNLLYTIGHSNRTLEAFLEVLDGWGVEVLVDIRAYPRSRLHPQFDSEVLRTALSGRNIVYHWAGRQLGGMRKPDAGSPHSALANGLRGYADHMGSETFRTGAAHLMQLATARPLAVMCAEKDPLHCHRSLLSDYLVTRDVEVRHIIDAREVVAHELRADARVDGDKLIYDRFTQAGLGF